MTSRQWPRPQATTPSSSANALDSVNEHAPSFKSSRFTTGDSAGGPSDGLEARDSSTRKAEEDITKSRRDGPLVGDGDAQLLSPPPMSTKSGNFPAASDENMGGIYASSQPSIFRPSSSDSRSHVSHIASSAFYRPLSSQKLQAHRAARPISFTGSFQSKDVEEEEDNKSDTQRNSTGSAYTMKGGHALPRQEVIPSVPPMTWRTPTAEWNDESRSRDVSPTPEVPPDLPNTGILEGQTRRPDPGVIVLEKGLSNEVPEVVTEKQKPQRSFFSTVRLNDRGHERLSSSTSSPKSSKISKPSTIKSRNGRNWEYFTGNTIFWCGGRLQNARDRPVSIITGILVVLPAGLFFAYSAPYLGSSVSPAVPFFFAYIFFICMSSYFHASFSDPGILPRNLHQFPPADPTEDPLALGPSNTRWEMVLASGSSYGAMEVPVKYCQTCNIWRPPRCHHCRVCNSCIETQDHHCVWLNNCIGRRNYRYFLTFTGTSMALGMFLMSASIAHIVIWKNRNHATMAEAIDRWRVPFAMFLYGALAFPYPGALWVYHILLMAWGRTTREYLNSRKFQKEDRHRPFAHPTILQNWRVALFKARSPTYLSFKKDYVEGDQRFGPRRGKQTAPLVAEYQEEGGVQPTGVEMRKLNDVAPVVQQQSSKVKGQMNRTPREKLDYPSRA